MVIEQKKGDAWEKFVDSVFHMKKSTKILILLMVIGLILRIIAALNLGVFADDMHFAPHAIDFIDSGKLQTWDQGPLWYMFTDISYGLLGTTQLASRMAAIIFGTLTIFIVFLLGKEIFGGNKSALIGAVFATFSPFLIWNTLAEMDVMMMFFALLAIWIFIVGLKKNNNNMLYLSMVVLGIASLTKYYALLFLPGLWIYYYFERRSKESDLQILKTLFFMGCVFTIAVSPLLISNYLTYTSQGILDFQFTRVFHLGYEKAAQYYSWAAGFNEGPDYLGFFIGNAEKLGTKLPSSIISLKYLWEADPLVLVLGLAGLVLLFRKNKKMAWLISLLFIVPWFMLGSTSLLSKHYLFMTLLLAPVAGNFVYTVVKRQNTLRYVVGAIILFNLVFLAVPWGSNSNFYSASAENGLINLKDAEIPKNSLVVVDSRIYRGRIAFEFNDRHYIETSSLLEFVKQTGQQGDTVDVDTYVVECVRDDCGWGTIKDQKDFNETTESLLGALSQNAELIGEVKMRPNKFNILGFGQPDAEPYYRVYKKLLSLNPAVIQYADSTHSLFLYSVGYTNKDKLFDAYNLNIGGNGMYYFVGRFVLWIDFIGVFALSIWMFYYAFKEELV